MTTPYQAKSRIEIYQEKLASRGNNKNWIFGNYFGKPGGGAPLIDKQGNKITNLKSVADGKIYQSDPAEFSKVDNYNNINPYNNNNNNNYYRPLSSDNYNNYNRFINDNENMQKTYFNNNNYDNNNNNENNKNDYLDQFKAKNNIYILPVPIYNNNQPINNNNNPILPINTLNINYPSPSNLNNNNNNIPINNIPNNNYNINDNNNLNQIPIQIDQNIKSITNPYLNYDDKTKAKIELQKELYRKELLQQMEEKKQRDLAEKKKLEELDKNEEIKYKDYLKMKKDQHDKQELKRKNKLNNIKDNNVATQNDFSMISEPSIIEINNNEINNNTNINNSNINENNRIISPNLKKKNDLQNLIDNNSKNITSSLKIDIENEMKRLIDNNPERYVPFSPNILNNLNNIDIHEESQKQLKFAQDRAETRNLINYIFGKSNNLYSNIDNKSLYDKILNNNLPSYFAINKDNPNTKYNKLNSTSDFILTGNEKNHEPIVNYVKVDDSMNYNSTFGKNLQNENLLSNSLNLSKSLDNKSNFIPINNPEINNQNSKIVYIPNPSDKANFTENKDFKLMYDKLDEIEELNKKKPNNFPEIQPIPFSDANNFPINSNIPPQYEKYHPFNQNNYIPPVINDNYIPEKKDDKKKKKKKKKNDDDDINENIVFNLGGKILDKKDLRKDGNKFIIDLPQPEQPEIKPEPEKEEEEEEEEEDDKSSNVKMQIIVDGEKINKDKAEKLISEGKFPGMSLPGQEIPKKERKTKKKKTNKKPTIIYKDEYEEEEEPEAIIEYDNKKITKEEAKKLVEENKITVNDEIMDLLGIVEKPKPKEKTKKKKKKIIKKPEPQPNVIQTSEQFEVDKKEEEKNEETEEYLDEEEEEKEEQIGIGYYDQEEQD